MSRYPFISLIREERRGKGLAVKRGMLAGRGEYLFICDADLSMPIEEVSKFLPPQLEDYDVAIASREVEGARRYGEPAYRHLMGRVFNLLVRLLAVRTPNVASSAFGGKWPATFSLTRPWRVGVSTWRCCSSPASGDIASWRCLSTGTTVPTAGSALSGIPSAWWGNCSRCGSTIGGDCMLQQLEGDPKPICDQLAS